MADQVQFLYASTSQALGSGALNYTTSFLGNFRIMQVTFKASSAISETIVASLDSKSGAGYDVILDTTTLSSAQNYVWRPSGQCIFVDGDQLVLTCTNATATASLYVTIVAEPLGRQP